MNDEIKTYILVLYFYDLEKRPTLFHPTWNIIDWRHFMFSCSMRKDTNIAISNALKTALDDSQTSFSLLCPRFGSFSWPQLHCLAWVWKSFCTYLSNKYHSFNSMYNFPSCCFVRKYGISVISLMMNICFTNNQICSLLFSHLSFCVQLHFVSMQIKFYFNKCNLIESITNGIHPQPYAEPIQFN